MVWGVITVVSLAALAAVIALAIRVGKNKERARQATVDADRMEKADEVGSMSGPRADRLGEYWNRLRRVK